jgi:hypothetical protein
MLDIPLSVVFKCKKASGCLRSMVSFIVDSSHSGRDEVSYLTGAGTEVTALSDTVGQWLY